MSGLIETLDQLAGMEFGRRLIADRIEPEERFLIPAFQRRTNPPLNTSSYQNDFMDWDIRLGERVLDIGSGGWPFRKSTHLADMFTGETSHRYEALRRDKRPFVVLDIRHMRFADRQWDFTFCSHVLEHLNRPGDAIRELVRVSQRGLRFLRDCLMLCSISLALQRPFERRGVDEGWNPKQIAHP
jgi:SAM-dependent methyltransferase